MLAVARPYYVSYVRPEVWLSVLAVAERYDYFASVGGEGEGEWQ